MKVSEMLTLTLMTRPWIHVFNYHSKKHIFLKQRNVYLRKYGVYTAYRIFNKFSYHMSIMKRKTRFVLTFGVSKNISRQFQLETNFQSILSHYTGKHTCPNEGNVVMPSWNSWCHTVVTFWRHSNLWLLIWGCRVFNINP